MEIEIQTTQEIILATAACYNMSEGEWISALDVIYDERQHIHLSDEAEAFVMDIMVWASYERISPVVIHEAVRSLYETC